MEHEIQLRLSNGESALSIAESFATRWFHPETTDDQRRQMAVFLFHSGQFVTLAQVCAQALQKKTYIPWDVLVEWFSKLRHFSEEARQWLVEGIQSETAMDHALRSYGFDEIDERFAEHRKAIQSNTIAQISSKKRKLLDKLEYIRAQRLLEEESKLLKELNALDPDDPTVAQWMDDYRWRWAREVINRTRTSEPLQSQISPTLTFTEDEKTFLQLLFAQVEEILQNDKSMALDFAVMFYFFDDIEKALHILENTPRSWSSVWLMLDFLLQCSRPVEALDLVYQLQQSVDSQPERKLSLMYFKARALYSLGQKHEAQDTLKQLLQVEPHYRSAERLLAIWEGKL